MSNEIQTFLERAASSKEAGLMVARDGRELEELEREVSNFGFEKANNVREIFRAIQNGKKVYFILKGGLGSNVYGILAQYPTGQINAYDGEKNLVADPNCQTGTLLVLITKQDLETIESGEKSLLALVGITWRA